MYNIEARFIKSTISESVVDLNQNQKDDVLLSVVLEFTKTEGDISAILQKEIHMNIDYLPEDFVPLSQITEETKVEWALNNITEKQWYGINYNLEKQLRYNAKFDDKITPDIKNKLDYETKVLLQRRNKI